MTIHRINGDVPEWVNASGTWQAVLSGGSGFVQDSLFDAKGDILVASADDTPDRLPVGADGEVLVADSAQTLGVKWDTPTFGATVDVEDEGTPEGAADTLDFTGAGVSVAFAAGVATIDIPGGGSGGTVDVEDHGAAEGAAATIDFTGEVDVAFAGSTATVDVLKQTGATATARRTAGNLTLNSSTWANVDTGMDLVIAAADGDWIEVGSSGVWGNQAVFTVLDVVSMVAGSPVSSWGVGGAIDATGTGIRGWSDSGTDFEPFSGSVVHQITSADISGGNVTLRLRYRQGVAGNKTLFATATNILQFWAHNLRQP